MAGSRFHLQEKSKPEYSAYLPEKDPNNAIWSRISLIAKMLNEIPWGTWGEEDTEKVITDPKVIEAMDKMEDYTPSEKNAEDTRDPVYSVGEGGNETEAKHAAEQMQGYESDTENRQVSGEQKAAYDKLFGPSRESVEYFAFSPYDLKSPELGRFNGDRRPAILRQDEEWDEGYGLPEIEDVDDPYKFTTGPTGDIDDDAGGVEYIGTNGKTRYTPSEARTKYYRGANR